MPIMEYDVFGAPYLYPQTTEFMTPNEEQNLIAQAQNGDQDAMNEIVAKYERLCHKLARKFAFTANSFNHEDLVQEARIGLIKAIRSYEADRGAKPITRF